MQHESRLSAEPAISSLTSQWSIFKRMVFAGRNVKEFANVPGNANLNSSMKGMAGMIFLTEQAVTKLKTLILEHPEDPFVRVRMRDLDEARLSYNITLEDKIQPDDEVQEVQGLTVGVEGQSASRMHGITMDYEEPDGFKFIHPQQEGEPKLDIFNLN